MSFYSQDQEFYQYSYNEVADNGPQLPIIFYPENTLFPNQKSVYDSNCLIFWKYITDNEVPGIDLNRYLISSHGHTWDNQMQNRISCNCSAGNGYYIQMNLHLRDGGQIVKKLHRILMMLFNPIDNPEKFQVNHKDTMHHHNNISNLEWCDDAYNRLHGILNNAGSNIFTDQIVILYPHEVHEMKILKDQGYTNQQVADILNSKRYSGVHKHLVSRTSLGQSKLYSPYYK